MPPGTWVQAEEGASAGARGQVREKVLGRSGRAGVGGATGDGGGWLAKEPCSQVCWGFEFIPGALGRLWRVSAAQR